MLYIYVLIYIYMEPTSHKCPNIMMSFLSKIDRKHIEPHYLECLTNPLAGTVLKKKHPGFQTTKLLGSITSGKKHSEC